VENGPGGCLPSRSEGAIPEDQDMLDGKMIAHGAYDREIGMYTYNTLRSLSD
jgi:hypothetical protein